MKNEQKIRCISAALAIWMIATLSVGQEIFVPHPKGASETLEHSIDSVVFGEKKEMVTTRQGDRISGKVLGIEAGGTLRMVGPEIQGEVLVLVSKVEQVVLRSRVSNAGKDVVHLTNGDKIRGRIVGLDQEAVFVETSGAGRMKISRKIVRNLRLDQGSSVLLESDFSTGEMDPWTPRGGSWSVTEDGLVSAHNGNNFPLVAKLDQKEAITFVAKVQAVNNLYCEMTLFVDDPQGTRGRNSVMAFFRDNQYYLQYTQNGNTNNIANQSFGRNIKGGLLRFAYDPKTAKATLWLDSTLLGQFAVPNRLSSGRHLMFNSHYPIKVESIRVLRGIVPPPNTEGEQDTKSDQVQLANGDRLSIESVVLSNGEFHLKTSFGELRCPLEAVTDVDFGTEGLEEPRRRKDDVRARSSAGSLTFEFIQLTGEHLIGRHDYIGEIKISRSSIQEIKLNLYR